MEPAEEKKTVKKEEEDETKVESTAEDLLQKKGGKLTDFDLKQIQQMTKE